MLLELQLLLQLALATLASLCAGEREAIEIMGCYTGCGPALVRSIG
jgi:hypothetical protein